MDLKALVDANETVVIVGFFDLMGFAKWSKGRLPSELLDLATVLSKRTGRVIADGGGHLVKMMGDAGMFIFPADDPDHVVNSLQAMKRNCDIWLADRGYPDVIAVRIQLGPVACGRVGSPGDERFDVYGETVNRAAMMQGRSFAVGASLFDLLEAKSKRGFKRFNEDEFVFPR